MTIETLLDARKKLEALRIPPSPLKFPLQVIIVKDRKRLQRSIIERLFTFPWRPFERKKWVDNPEAPPKGQAWSFGGRLIMRESDVHDLETQVQAAGVRDELEFFLR